MKAKRLVKSMIVSLAAFLPLGLMYLFNLAYIYADSDWKVVGFDETYPGYPSLIWRAFYSLLYLYCVKLCYNENKDANDAISVWLRK